MSGLSWGERPEDHDAHRRAWDALQKVMVATEEEYRVGLMALEETRLRLNSRAWTRYQAQRQDWVNRNLDLVRPDKVAPQPERGIE